MGVVRVAKDIDVRLKLTGLNRLMRSEPVQAEVNKQAARMAARAGSKFQAHPSTHRWTARAFVEPKKGERLTDADRLALLRALWRQ